MMAALMRSTVALSRRAFWPRPPASMVAWAMREVNRSSSS